MRISDLSFGSIVKLGDEIHRVVNIYGSKNAVGLDGREFLTYVNELEPVGITEELMMKNFQNTDYGVTWYPTDTKGEYCIRIAHENKEGETVAYLLFVHELQTFLKICGKKLIIS